MRKALDINKSTSIIIPHQVLNTSNQLSLVADNGRGNSYYQIGGRNAVIMRVEQDFCILIDYMVNVYNDPRKCNLPIMLCASQYHVYQVPNSTHQQSRDWIRNTASSAAAGFDIKTIMYGNGCRVAGTTLDHIKETWNELDKFKAFTAYNINHGSHRRRVLIGNNYELSSFIQGLINKGHR